MSEQVYEWKDSETGERRRAHRTAGGKLWGPLDLNAITRELLRLAARVKELEGELEETRNYFDLECENSTRAMQRATAAERALEEANEALVVLWRNRLVSCPLSMYHPAILRAMEPAVRAAVERKG